MKKCILNLLRYIKNAFFFLDKEENTLPVLYQINNYIFMHYIF